MRNALGRPSIALLLASGLVLSTSLTAAASPMESELDPIEAIESVAPESLAAVVTDDGVVHATAAALEPDEYGRSLAEAPEYVQADPEVVFDVPSDPAEGIKISQDGLEDIVIGLPNAADAENAIYGELDVAIYDNQDGSTTVPIVRPDGSIQITTVIEGPESPTRYAYPISLPDGGQLVDAGDGYVAIVDAREVPVAMISPPWALDANGNGIATRYEIEGTTLVQVVDHARGDRYPIVADPAAKGRYIKSVKASKVAQGYTVSVQPVNPWKAVPKDAYYAEYKLYVGSAYEGQKYRDQLQCHYDFSPFKTPWNLDSWRPNVGYVSTVWALCNP